LNAVTTSLTFGSSVSLPKLKNPNEWVVKESANFRGMRLVQVTMSSSSQPTRIFSLFLTLDLSKGLMVGEIHRRFDGYVRKLDQLARGRD